MPPNAIRPDEFRGDKKTGRWLLQRAEKSLVRRGVDRVPRWLETHHLTLLTLPWCAMIVLAGFLAASFDLRWLALSSLGIALQYVTDLFDGAVGRHRDTGLVKWGYFMDHFLDFVFLCSVLVSWSFLLPAERTPWLLALYGVAGAFMVNAFLAFAATGEFEISHFGVGPTEMRLGFIGINTAVMVFGAGWLATALPAATLALSGLLAFVVAANGRKLWRLDMKTKARQADEGGTVGAA